MYVIAQASPIGEPNKPPAQVQPAAPPPSAPVGPVAPEPPPMADMINWLRDMPDAFKKDSVATKAVLGDLMETLLGKRIDASLSFAQAGANVPSERVRILYLLAAARLLWHPYFRSGWIQSFPNAETKLRRFLSQDIGAMAYATNPSKMYDEERLEELVRLALRAFGTRPPGEGEDEAKDRFSQVDSVEARKLMMEMKAREEKRKKEEKAREEKAKR